MSEVPEHFDVPIAYIAASIEATGLDLEQD